MAPIIRPMSVQRTAIDGLMVIDLKEVTDDRGTVREFYRASSWREAELPDLGPWQQLNVTATKRGAVRGLHGESMTKLVAVVAGAAFGAYVDTRPNSPTFGAVETVQLELGRQVLVPNGVCNGFQALGDPSAADPGAHLTQYLYSFDAEWVPGMAGTALTPLDAALNISWPLPIEVGNPAAISEKDANAPTLAALTTALGREVQP